MEEHYPDTTVERVFERKIEKVVKRRNALISLKVGRHLDDSSRTAIELRQLGGPQDPERGRAFFAITAPEGLVLSLIVMGARIPNALGRR